MSDETNARVPVRCERLNFTAMRLLEPWYGRMTAIRSMSRSGRFATPWGCPEPASVSGSCATR